jgi:hypothetical protein
VKKFSGSADPTRCIKKERNEKYLRINYEKRELDSDYTKGELNNE